MPATAMFHFIYYMRHYNSLLSTAQRRI